MPANVQTMAYVNQVPWHGLGNQLTEHATIDEWQKSSGLDWLAKKAAVTFDTDPNNPDAPMYEVPNQFVLYRSDNHFPLGIVSKDFKTDGVQPPDILEFFRDITNLGTFTMETAGVLDHGKRIWALAKSSLAASLGKDDPLKLYLFLATGLDGKFATHASFTSIRIVCNNTLQLALRDSKDSTIRVPHRSHFNADNVKQQLGLADDSFSDFMARADKLATKQVSQKQTETFYANLFGTTPVNTEEELIECLDSRVLKQVLDVHNRFPGQNTKSAKGTAWGLVNGATAYLDHVRGARTVNSRLKYAWLGRGRALKDEAMDLAEAI